MKLFLIQRGTVRNGFEAGKSITRGIVRGGSWKSRLFWGPKRHPTSVADPDPDPHVFGPPGSGSGSTSQRYGSGPGSCSGSGSGSFYHHAKIVRKTLIPTILLLFLTFYI
jgi:hypothetical protein